MSENLLQFAQDELKKIKSFSLQLSDEPFEKKNMLDDFLSTFTTLIASQQVMIQQIHEWKQLIESWQTSFDAQKISHETSIQTLNHTLTSLLPVIERVTPLLLQSNHTSLVQNLPNDLQPSHPPQLIKKETARQMLELFDLLFMIEKNCAENSPQTHSIRTSMKKALEILKNQGIEKLEIVRGAPFNTLTMESIQTVKQKESNLPANMVHEVLQLGFCFSGTKQIIRRAKVSVVR